MKKDNINKCQYWNANEPSVCVYWDVGSSTCNYASANSEEGVLASSAQHAPYCNLLGTHISCLQYKSAAPGVHEPRCILPDPRRHVCNRTTGFKWVTSKGSTGGVNGSGYDILVWDFESINGYNDGECDNMGTDTTCSGYSSYHLGFGTLQPSSDLYKYDTFVEGRYSTEQEFGYRLPTNYVVYNIRAKLSKCYWWKDSSLLFGVSENGVVELLGTWSCICSKDTSLYSEFSEEAGPPCNGCKPECANYTGVCWQYCIDEKMETGDPVLAEQIHELRYYHREHKWTHEAIQHLFLDEGDIFTWDGEKDSGKPETEVGVEPPPETGATVKGILNATIGPDGYIEEYRIPSVKVSMPSFEEFFIQTENVELTKGTTITKTLDDYPTLIRQLQLLPLSPIIHTEFTQYTNLSGKTCSLFETPYLKRDLSVLIYGKVFYSEPVYAINISDKDIKELLPHALYYFDDVYSAQEAIPSESYEEFNTELKAKFAAIVKLAPEKVVTNSLPEQDLTFLMDVDVLSLVDTYDGSNENTILVFQEVDGFISYDKITFTKRVVGGMLFQNNFEIRGDGKSIVPIIPYFEKSFMTTLNDNGDIGFSFYPFSDAGITTESLYVYNDSFIRDPLSGDGYVGNTRYKITINQYQLEATQFNESAREFKLIGSNGYILVTLNDLKINSVYKPFEVEEIEIVYFKEFFNENGEIETSETTCAMEIVHHGADGKMACNQLLIKPKNMEDFSSLCDVSINLKKLTYWEKRSFDQQVDPGKGSIIKDMYPNTTNSFDVGEFEGNASRFTLKNFKFVMAPSVVMANSQGRPFVQSRTKPLGAVKQVGCPDIEIRYIWQGAYTLYQNIPVCKCCGAWFEEWRSSKNLFNMDPPCGDHFECVSCYPAAVWWPYNRCMAYKSYSQVSAHDNYDLSMIGLFKEKDGDGGFIHGAHDIRMLGPHDAYAHGGLFCNPLKPCSCERETFNHYREGDSYFVGFGKVRAAASDTQVAIWRGTGSDPIMQFGNEVRSVLRSYRTLDQAPYIAINPRTNMPYTEWKLMPATQMFSRADITADVDEMWDYFASSEGPNVVNPLGFLLATSFDDLEVNEEVDYMNRFRFDDIIACNNSFDLGYPKTVGDYVVVYGDSIVSPWYEFKAYPVGGETQQVQWAWQEVWKKLERNFSVEDGVSFAEFVSAYMKKGTSGKIKGTYLEDGNGKIFGMHQTLDLNHPEYEYDWQNREYRLTMDEGESILKFSAPEEKDEYTGEYKGYASFQLNSGPRRGINWAGEWLTSSNADGELGSEPLGSFNVILYEKCIGVPTDDDADDENFKKGWSDAVHLFDTGYNDQLTSTAEDDERMILTVDAFGNRIKTYFQRGLSVELFENKLGSLPLQMSIVTQIEQLAEFREVVGSYFPTQEIGFKFEEIKRTVGRVSMTFKFGSEVITPEIPTGPNSPPIPATYSFFNMPQINVYAADFGTMAGATLLYSSNGMELYEGTVGKGIEIRTVDFEWENTWKYIGSGKKGVLLEFRVIPSAQEIAEATLRSDVGDRFITGFPMVHVTGADVWDEKLVDAIENLLPWERKYYVSYGDSADCPPQGRGTASVLDKLADNNSTCWQKDSKDGVSGVENSKGDMSFVSKVRGRIVFDAYEDEHELTGSIAEMENLQKKLYDQAAEKAVVNTNMTGILPPGLKQLLADNGVRFNGPGRVTLKNSLITTLAEINQFPKMQGGGHSYLPSTPWHDGCGVSRCMAGDAFAYGYTNNDDGSYHAAVDSFTQFNMGTEFLMQRRSIEAFLQNTIFPSRYTGNTQYSIYKKSSDDFSTLIYPSIPIKAVNGRVSGVTIPKRSNPVLPFYWGGMWGITNEPIYGYNPGW